MMEDKAPTLENNDRSEIRARLNPAMAKTRTYIRALGQKLHTTA